MHEVVAAHWPDSSPWLPVSVMDMLAVQLSEGVMLEKMSTLLLPEICQGLNPRLLETHALELEFAVNGEASVLSRIHRFVLPVAWTAPKTWWRRRLVSSVVLPCCWLLLTLLGSVVLLGEIVKGDEVDAT